MDMNVIGLKWKKLLIRTKEAQVITFLGKALKKTLLLKCLIT